MLAEPGLISLLQSSGLTLIIGYLGIKELRNFLVKKNDHDDRTKWKDLFNQHDKRLHSIESKQSSMDGKLDTIITAIIRK